MHLTAKGNKESRVALRKESVDRNNAELGAYKVEDVVALRKESVDRNLDTMTDETAINVALRKESVDRNMYSVNIQPFGRAVALRKESVDRNHQRKGSNGMGARVALRKESVDRNLHLADMTATYWWSLSARRAWIEIQFMPFI